MSTQEIEAQPPVVEVKVDETAAKPMGQPEAVGIAFAHNDPENPQGGWATGKRWRSLFIALFVSYTSAFNATANGAASGKLVKQFHTTSSIFQTSSFTYLVMLGIGPMVFAPVSESFGRRPTLVILTGIIAILFIPQALTPNIYGLIITRLFQGTAACIEGPVAAGVVADLYAKVDRGGPFALFVLTIFTANATGPVCANWIVQKIGWHWLYWVQLIAAVVCFLLCLFFFDESRGEVILAKRAEKLTEETGRHHYVAGVDIALTETIWEATRISVSRPIKYLFTEPIVTGISLYIGFAWGVVFLFVGAVAHVFQKTYGFSQGQSGTVLICGFIGAFIGFLETIFVQERFYSNAVKAGGGKAAPEVRLYSASVGAWVFCIGCFGFAWTARPWIHWIAPCIFLVIINSGIYTMYLATYAYLGDVYNEFSSSAQASQGLLRNTLGATFPFFGVIMYDKLTFPWASTLLGFIAGFFAFVPAILIMYGAKLRERSKIASTMERNEGDILRDDPEVMAEVVRV
ncbi:hypothetical protein MNV49_004611 [Pseudohyphozyma bogoriensis]|nr:hypothetical protein MNV49_004611 [Pseudohyphozyma bogoriensis]